MPPFDARAKVSRKPHVKSLAVMMPSTLSRRVTTIHRVFLSSITRAAARNVVSGLTVATGDVMTSWTRTLAGFFPFDVTCHRMSRSVIRPIGRPCWTTTSPPIFFAAMRFAASRTVRSGSMTMTSRVITSRTKTIACPHPDIAASHQGFRAERRSSAFVASVHIAPESSERILPGVRREVVSMPSNMMDMKMVQCGCGFMMQSHSENEIVKMTQMHAKETHHPAMRARIAGSVVFLQEGRVPKPSDQRGLVRSELREYLVQVTPRFVDHLRKGRAALGDRGHPVLEVAGHLRICDVGTVDRQGVDQGASRGRGPDRTATDILPAEQEVEDLVTRRFRAEAEPLHREEERPLRV